MPDPMLNEEERMLQSLVRDFADRELVPRAREVDEREEFDWQNWQGMARLIDQGPQIRRVRRTIKTLVRGNRRLSLFEKLPQFFRMRRGRCHHRICDHMHRVQSH